MRAKRAGRRAHLATGDVEVSIAVRNADSDPDETVGDDADAVMSRSSKDKRTVTLGSLGDTAENTSVMRRHLRPQALPEGHDTGSRLQGHAEREWCDDQARIRIRARWEAERGARVKPAPAAGQSSEQIPQVSAPAPHRALAPQARLAARGSEQERTSAQG